VSSWELPRFAGVDSDTIVFVVRFAHTYNPCREYNAFRFEDDSKFVVGCVVVLLLVQDR